MIIMMTTHEEVFENFNDDYDDDDDDVDDAAADDNVGYGGGRDDECRVDVEDEDDDYAENIHDGATENAILSLIRAHVSRLGTELGQADNSRGRCILIDSKLQAPGDISTSSSTVQDYQSVKKTLLRRFGCDKNGFKSKFLSAKPSQDEDLAFYINRVARYFNRWLELAQVSDFDSLSFLILSEIALQPCDAEFVAYIKDHSPTSFSFLKTQATSYLDARPSKSFIKDSATSFAGESVRPTARSDSRRPSIHSYRSQTHTRANTPSLGRHTLHKYRLATDHLHMAYTHS
ncbi:hypothetical protein PoB_007294400, partial [Plakobranchus ocellatus]